MSRSIAYMQQALTLARKGLGRTAPNPAVGAVVVRNGQVVGRGFHPAAGEPHAEIFALREAGDQAAGADMYVTLEPCVHHGRTGPCAEALIRSGIRRVHVGTVDPNPKVAGRGIQRLLQAGIATQVGLCEKECRELIAAFSWHIQHRTPFTIYKSAMTFDGQLATRSHDSRWVSGDLSRQRVHVLRDQVDAIMVGIGTVLADDPQLTTRLAQGGRDPLRVVVDSQLKTPPDSRLVRNESPAKTLVATTGQASSVRREALSGAGCEVLILPDRDGHVVLSELWRELGRRGVQSLLLEGGRTLAASALRAGLINRLQLYLAPKLIGGEGVGGLFAGEGCLLMGEAMPLENLNVERVGEDLLLTAEVKRCLPD